MEKIIKDYNFTDFFDVSNKLSIANLFSSLNHCGIYILRFRNGDYYIGQSVDIAMRYKQHCRNYEDIEHICYTLVGKHNLNKIEKELIERFEQNGFKLRNIALTSFVIGETELSQIIDKYSQSKWLESINPPFYFERKKLSKQQHKYEKKFQKLLKNKDYEKIRPFLREYFRYCIIEPNLTEMDFWRVSCLPGGSLLIRLNIYKQEVLSIYSESAELYFNFHITKSIIKPSLYSYVRSRFSDLKYSPHLYKTGGSDQFEISTVGVKSAMNILADEKYRQAIKTFNLRLMNKGIGLNVTSHCVDLANDVLS